MDDFGAGFNSLLLLGEIPFDILKIGKYFIDRIERIEIKNIVKTVISYAHELDKIVIAEGVETEEQLTILQELDCDKIQGYYYSKPLSPLEFEKYYWEFKN